MGASGGLGDLRSERQGRHDPIRDEIQPPSGLLEPVGPGQAPTFGVRAYKV